MKYIKTYEDNKNENYFYTVNQGSYLICDIAYCAKSDRTFDIYLFDLLKNEKLQTVLFGLSTDKKNTLIDFLSRLDEEKTKKLKTNPELRILVQDEDLFLDVLEIFDPDDIRVKIRKYNL